MTRFHYWLRRVASFLIGLVFFVSGLLKLMDPVGTKLIVEAYLHFLKIGFLDFAALPAGVLLALVEAWTGAALITGVFRRLAALTASVLIGFFTLVTLVLWIANPEMDCGCFGEAVHLTHRQSFLKNVVLCVLAVIAFVPLRHYGRPRRHKYLPFWLVAVSLAAFSVYSLLYIPLVDFTPFNLSSMLYAAAGDEPDADTEEYVQAFVYEKNGKEGVFTLDRLPDSTWTFVRAEPLRKQDHIRETAFPALPFTDAEGNYRDVLAASGPVMVVSVYHPEKLSARAWNETAALLSGADGEGFTPLLLLAAAPGTVRTFLSSDAVDAATAQVLSDAAYYADYKTLVSLNRSNGGAVYFHEGNLIEKWARRNLPDAKRLAKLARKDATDAMVSSSTKGRLSFQAFVLYAFAALLFL